MKNSIIIIFGLFFLNAYSQKKINFDEHIESIRSEKYMSEDMNGKFNANEKSVDYALNYLKNKGHNTKYITNKNLLIKVQRDRCKDSSLIHFKDNIDGKKVELKITFKEFKKEKHKFSEINGFQSINGKVSYGAFYGIPKIEIGCFRFTVNGNRVNIDKSIIKKFYNIDNICNAFDSVELYASNDAEYFFLYLDGGNSADSYFAKLIFRNNKYVTEIIATYKQLRSWDRYGNPNFLGF